MQRRNFLHWVPLVAAADSVTDVSAQTPQKKEKGLAFTIAHITDVHIRPDFGIFRAL